MTAKKNKYNKELLLFIITRDKCTINLEELINVNSHCNIDYVCSCGLPGTKNFQKIYEKGCFCRKCTLEISNKNRKNTCLLRYNTECPLQNKEIIEKTHKTNLEKYGVLDPSVLQEFRNKMKQTCLEKYGVEHYTKTDECKNKHKEYCLEKYGVDHYSKTQDFKDKFKKTCLLRFNTNTPIQNEEIKNKIMNKCLEKYGVKHPMQNKFVSDKQSKTCYKLKDFVFPCGAIFKVQGYEHFALGDLVKDGYSSKDIIVSRKDVPEIWYIDSNNNERRYFPDIYIPKLNKIIEVKSNWTYKMKKDMLELKANACITLGFNYEIRIYSRNNTELIIIEY